MARHLIDETSNRYGKLTVLARGPNTNHNHTTWLCKCDCGRHSTVQAGHLRQGKTKSCGWCIRKRYQGSIKITKEWLHHQYWDLGLSHTDIGTLLGDLSRSTIHQYCKKFGIRGRTSKERRTPLSEKWCPLNIYSSYALGLLFSDGYISVDQISIVLQSSDKPLLDNFQSYFGGTFRLRSDSGAIEWYVCSRNLSDWLLTEFGLRSPKSVEMPPVPDLIPTLMPHFIRGIFDGDGCFYNQKGRSRLNLVFSSADRGFLDQIDKILPVQSSIYRNIQGCYDWRSARKETVQANLKWMWCNGEGFHLDRKWRKAGFIKD